jgi:hypothetical protein
MLEPKYINLNQRLSHPVEVSSIQRNLNQDLERFHQIQPRKFPHKLEFLAQIKNPLIQGKIKKRPYQLQHKRCLTQLPVCEIVI